MKDISRRRMAAEVSVLYTALLSVGQSEEVAAVAQLLIDRLDTPGARLALVGAALPVAPSDPSLDRWLDEAEASGEAVRARSLRRRLVRARETEQTEADPRPKTATNWQHPQQPSAAAHLPAP